MIIAMKAIKATELRLLGCALPHGPRIILIALILAKG